MSAQERAAQAGALFDRGYNCAQAVACAFADLTGLPEERIAKVASSFGGGKWQPDLPGAAGAGRGRRCTGLAAPG